MTPELEKLIADWEATAKTLEAVKAKELVFRNELISKLFPRHKEEGSESYILPNPDYKITAAFSLNYSLDKDEEALQNCFDRLGTMEDGEWIIENLFKRKLELVPKIYNLLPPVYKAIVDEIVTIKPSTPQVKFIAPKPDNKEKGLF